MRTAWLAVVVASLLSCSALPEYAAPKGAVLEPGSVDMSDVIPYRALTREDFKSANVPPQFGAYADRVGAATCCHIFAAPGAQVMTRSVRSKDGTLRYEATPIHIQFHSQMDRSCSWWNPKDLGLPQEYILEHEQIHFAICELEARRLNASVHDVDEPLSASAGTAEAAGALVQKQLRERLEQRVTLLLSRSRDFDEDTSLGHDPKAQKAWLARVQAELAASGD